MYDQCMEVGPKYCIQVKYEDLVLHPRPTLKKILEFADLEWTENVMEHQKHMEHISLSAVEKSTDQVIKEMITKNTRFLSERMIRLNNEIFFNHSQATLH